MSAPLRSAAVWKSVVAALLLGAACGDAPVVVPAAPDAQLPPDAACASPCGAQCCTAAEVCNDEIPRCELPCTPLCDRRECGAGGCPGIECGMCARGSICEGSRCATCTGSCAGRQCGDDGCGYSCGTCGPGARCQWGRCVLSSDGGLPPDAAMAPDAGAMRPDAGMPPDAGAIRPDAGTPPDAGAMRPDAGTPSDAGAMRPDAGMPPDAGVVPARPVRVLFDNTKAEQAGNADWVVDDSGRSPQPPNPVNETDWHGAISAWGVALARTGDYLVETLPPGGRISFRDGSNPQDLAGYGVYVLPEPNVAFSASEAQAIVEFVRAGGGLFIVADHGGADRNLDGVDAVKAWNDLCDATGDAIGIRFVGNDLWQAPVRNVATVPGLPVLEGPFGRVTATTYYAGSAIVLDRAANPRAEGLIWFNGQPHGDTAVALAISRLGSGRVVAIGDSSPCDDGTGTGAKLINGWDDPLGTNRALFLNATSWLAGFDP